MNKRRTYFVGLLLLVLVSFLSVPWIRVGYERDLRNKAAGLVQGMAAAMAAYGATVLTTNKGIKCIWDLDGNGIIDGDPRLEPGEIHDLAPDGFKGFIGQTGIKLPAELISYSYAPLDPWGKAVHVRLEPGKGFVVYLPKTDRHPEISSNY